MTLLQQLQALAPLAEAATAGPWEAYTDYTGWDGDPDTVAKPYETLVLGLSWSNQIGPDEWEGGSGPFICTTGTDPQEGAPDEDVPNAEPNAAFIAAARNVLTAENLQALCAALAAVALPAAGIAQSELEEIINEHFGHAYWCSREWLAWQVGTMTDEDFSLVSDSDTASELAAFLLNRIAPVSPPAAPAVTGWIAVNENGGPCDPMLEEEFLYVELPNGRVVQAMYTECNWQPEHTEIAESYAWGHYTEVDHMEPLPVQPVHYFTPPTTMEGNSSHA